MTNFENLGLSGSLLRAIRAQGYETATPIQAQAIPPALEAKDLMGCAQTGTGKTAAFALPTIQRLAGEADGQPRRGRRVTRALILAPTRELAAQIGDSFTAYGKHSGLRHTVIYGGVGQFPQVRALKAGVEILVATPGRLLDLMNQGYVDLKNIEILILDEADQMLDMGFIHDLRRIVSKCPRERQTLMFSATMPAPIRKLASEWLRNPVQVQVDRVASPAKRVKQSVFLVEPHHKPILLAHYLMTTACTRTLVFARTKHGADKIVKQLIRSGIRAAAIHGNKSQAARQRVLEDFKSNRPPVLVATDIAARGLDIDNVTHVINYELPEVPETYVHRIGRTGRAGAEGMATSFCGRDERGRLQQIERTTRQTIQIETDQPEYPADIRPAAPAEERGGQRPGSRKPSRRTGSGGRPAGAKFAGGDEGSTTGKSYRPQKRKNRTAANAGRKPRATGGPKPSGGGPSQAKRRKSTVKARTS